MTSILGDLFKEAKSLGKEAKHQVFGRPKKEKEKSVRVSIHYHFYREKKPRQKPPGLWG